MLTSRVTSQRALPSNENMKKIILLSTFFFSISIHALPDCPSDTSVRWNNCFGTYTYADGGKYVGEYKDNKRHGQGTYTFPSGNKHVGEYKDNKRHGQGTFIYANGEKYLGEFKDDKRHGQGTYTYADGEKYVGEYKDNKRHGQGTYTFANGERLVGYFMNDTYVPNICEEMGLVKGTESFGNCVLKLIDEL